LAQARDFASTKIASARTLAANGFESTVTTTPEFVFNATAPVVASAAHTVYTSSPRDAYNKASALVSTNKYTKGTAIAAGAALVGYTGYKLAKTSFGKKALAKVASWTPVCVKNAVNGTVLAVANGYNNVVNRFKKAPVVVAKATVEAPKLAPKPGVTGRAANDISAVDPKAPKYRNSDDVRKDTTLSKEEKLKIISKQFRGR